MNTTTALKKITLPCNWNIFVDQMEQMFNAAFFLYELYEDGVPSSTGTSPNFGLEFNPYYDVTEDGFVLREYYGAPHVIGTPLGGFTIRTHPAVHCRWHTEAKEKLGLNCFFHNGMEPAWEHDGEKFPEWPRPVYIETSGEYGPFHNITRWLDGTKAPEVKQMLRPVQPHVVGRQTNYGWANLAYMAVLNDLKERALGKNPWFVNSVDAHIGNANLSTIQFWNNSCTEAGVAIFNRNDYL